MININSYKKMMFHSCGDISTTPNNLAPNKVVLLFFYEG